MQVLVISQFFGTDTAAVGQFLADAAVAVSEAGHKVRVICGDSGYAACEAGKVESIPSAASEKARLDRDNQRQDAIDLDPVKNITFSHNKVKKLLSYATFYAGATWKALTVPKPDVILTLTAPPGLAWIGWLMQRMRGCRHVVWEMDVYPDIAVALGMPLAGLLAGLLAGVLDYPRRRADAVIALGDCMKDRLLQHKIPQERIFVAENWADGKDIFPMPFPELSPLRILYSGNLGLAHDVATLCDVMEQLAGDTGFFFDFVGGGPRRKALKDFCYKQGIENASFRTYVRQEQLGASLAECHIGLVTQKAATAGAVVPSKVYGLMAAGRPILYIGPATATPARLIRRFECGWHFECGDVDGVLKLLRYLQTHAEDIRVKGRLGRKAFEVHYDKPVGVARICRVLGVEIQNTCSAELLDNSKLNCNVQTDGMA